MRRLALLLASAALWLTGAGRDPADVIREVTRKVLADADRIPNYTCVETVTRKVFVPQASTLARECSAVLALRQHPTLDMVLRQYSTDRLRLDVTMTHDGEIFSWAGARTFENDDPTALVGLGPFATGGFGGYMIVVFGRDAKKFEFQREITAAGRTLMAYTFQVAQPDSHFRVKVGDSWAYAAYQGTVLVDSRTGELARMTLMSATLPQDGPECQVSAEMNFTKAAIGDSDFLLPQEVEQYFVNQFGQETQSTTTFSACREYRGESTISYSPPQTASGGEAPESAPAPAAVSGMLRFAMALAAPIDLRSAAAGDSFSARLLEPLRDGKRKTLAPRGAIVEGRLLRVQTINKPAETIVVLKPSAVRIRGVSLPLAAARDWTHPLIQVRNGSRRTAEFVLPRREEENAGLFVFPGSMKVIPRGYQTYWITIPAAK